MTTSLWQTLPLMTNWLQPENHLLDESLAYRVFMGGKVLPEDLNEAILQIKTHMPHTIFMMWNEKWAIDLQSNVLTAAFK